MLVLVLVVVYLLKFSVQGKTAILPPGVGGRQIPLYQVGWHTGLDIILFYNKTKV